MADRLIRVVDGRTIVVSGSELLRPLVKIATDAAAAAAAAITDLNLIVVGNDLRDPDSKIALVASGVIDLDTVEEQAGVATTQAGTATSEAGIATLAAAAANLSSQQAAAAALANTTFLAVHATALPRGLSAITIGGTAITGATPGTYALTPVGGSVTGIAANLVVDTATTAHIVITNPGLNTTGGTTAPTFANPAGATLPGGTTLAAVLAPLVPTTGQYWAPTSDSLYLARWSNDGTSTPAAVNNPDGSQIKTPTKGALDALPYLAPGGYDPDLSGWLVADVDTNYRILAGRDVKSVSHVFGKSTLDAPSFSTLTTASLSTPGSTTESGGDPDLSGYLDAKGDANYRLIDGVSSSGRERRLASLWWANGFSATTNYAVEERDGNLYSTHSGTETQLTALSLDSDPLILPDESAVLFQRTQSDGSRARWRSTLGVGPTVQRYAPRKSIAVWGDSMSENVGLFSWPSRLSAALHRSVVDGGVFGETSTQIMTRMVADNSYRDRTIIIEVGRNDILTTGSATILANIAAMVAHLTPYVKHIIIYPVFNKQQISERSGGSDYATIMAHNAAVAAAYPAYYADARTWMVNNGLAAAGLTATSTDLTDISQDCVPTSLRNAGDSLHHNQYGCNAMAIYAQQIIAARNY